MMERSTRFVTVVFAIVAAAVIGLTATAALLLRRGPGSENIRDGASAASEQNPTAVTLPGAPAPPSRGEELAAGVPPDAPVARLAHPGRSPSDPGVPAAAVVPGSQPGDRERGRLAGLAENFVDALRAAGRTDGIAAFPPKGTNPPKSGLIVPEDFALPEGYVRYYQVTDDGQRLQPILMFSPDHEFVDAAGHPIALPKDGLVPPEMAPPGLPIQMLELPDDVRSAAARSHARR